MNNLNDRERIPGNISPGTLIATTPDREKSACSGQQKLATALEFFQNNRSDSLGVKHHYIDAV